jgi:2'-5' RNA ligase
MDASFYAPAGTVSVSGGSVPVPASPNRLPSWVSQSAKDLPSFQVVPPSHRLNSEDLKLPDGTKMVGADGFLVPPARNFSMIVNAATRIFSYRFDEAMRDNFISARAMRRDAFIRGLLEERILPTINRKWQLEVDDDSHPDQKLVRDSLTKLIQNLPDFDAMKRALLDAVWFGRAGVQWNHYRNPEMENLWTIQKWDPVHGDSIQFTFDGTPAILMDAMTTGWYASHGATYGPGGDLRPTDRGGTALVLQRPLWRDRFALHVHMREKADFFEGELAGSVQGLGLRGLIYWHYVIRTEALTWMLTYMQSVGQMDLLVFNYPQGDDAAKLNAEANARKIIGKAAIACPRDPKGNWPPVEQIPMNSEGLKALHELISEYFDRHIERLIVGQSMSAGADKENGLGGTGRSDFAKQTKDEILIYDAGRFDSTFSKDVVGPLKRFNYAWAKFPVRFKSILPDLEAKDKVSNGTTLIQAGVKIKTDEFREAAGFSRPEEGDETVGGDQTMGMGGVPGANPNSPMHVAGPGGQGSQPFGQGPSNPAQKPPEPPAAAATYPRHTPALPAAAGGSMLPFPGERNANGHPPVRNDGGGGGGPGGGMGGPAAGGVGTSPAMGFPGGGNTYLPKFGDKDEWRNRVGFTRFDSISPPTMYDHKYGCLMAPLDGEALMCVLRAGSNILDQDLADEGREDKPHVTVRFGFEQGVSADDIGRVLANHGPVKLHLGKVGCFENDEHDVLFLEVHSPDLLHLHRKTSVLPHKASEHDYKPHATIGYVKKGLGKLYAEMIPAADYEATVDELEFKTADAFSLSPEPSTE